MKNRINKKFIASFVFLLALPLSVQAATPFLDNEALKGCMASGACSLSDIEIGLTLLIKYLLGVMGAVALVYFIYGALNWMMSGGRPERVKKGSSIMTQAIVGIFIAFGSYILISFFINEVLKARTEQQIEPQTRLDSHEQIVYIKK